MEKKNKEKVISLVYSKKEKAKKEQKEKTKKKTNRIQSKEAIQILECFKEASEEMVKMEANKVSIILLRDDQDSPYYMKTLNNNMSFGESVGLLEVAKSCLIHAEENSKIE